MFSKLFIRITSLSLSATLALSGCSLRTGDKGEPATAAKFSGEFQCLTEISENVNKYVSGEMKLTQVKEFSGCVQKALRDFAFYSEGYRKDGFRPQELVNFLNKHFIDENKITNGLMREAMNLKVLISGGSADFVTRAEFDRLIRLVGLIGDEAERHLPFVALYGVGSNQIDQGRVTYDQVRSAQEALRATAVKLAEVFKTSKYTYQLGSAQNFIEELRKFLNWEKHHKHVFDSKDLVRIIGSYKNILTGTSKEEITPDDWNSLLLTSADLIGFFVEYLHVIKKEDTLQGKALENFIQYAERIFALVQTSIQKQPGQVITFNSLNDLVDSFEKIKFLPLGLRASSIKPVLKLVVGRVLRDLALPDGKSHAIGLTAPALNEARKEFYIWADSQRYISDLANRQYVYKGFVPTLQNLNKKDLSKFFISSKTQDPRVQHITYIVENVRPMFREKDSRVWMISAAEREKYGVRHNFTNLGRLNFFGSLMRILIRGFADRERALNMSGLTIDEMETFYQTVRALGTDVKLMDPRSENVGIRSFREGNMFTFAGNGLQAPEKDLKKDPKGTKHLLTFIEGLELLTFIWSGGQVRDRFYDNALEKCKAVNAEPDIFNNVKLERECFFKNFSAQGYVEIDNMPHMKSYMTNLKDESQTEFYSGLEAIAKIRCEDPKYMEQAELATISTVLHYIEGLYVVYDRNRDGILNGYEVMAAFPRFNIFLAEQVEKLKGKKYDVPMLKAIFMFLAEHGEIPETFGDKASLFWKRYVIGYFNQDPEQFSFERMDKLKPQDRPKVPKLALTRSGLLKVLKMLNGATKVETPCPKK